MSDDLNGIPVDDFGFFSDVLRCNNCGSVGTLKRLEHVIQCCTNCYNIENIYRYVGEPPTSHRNYPHTAWITFRSPVNMPQLGDDNWQWMSALSRKLSGLLIDQGLGYGDGFGGGFGELDVHFFVNNIDRAVEVIRDALTNDELIQYANILSIRSDDVPGNWRIHYPPPGGPDNERSLGAGD